MPGTVRRTMDFSDHRALFKVRSVELRVREASETRSQAYLTADFSNQRSEYLSLGGIVGATLAVPIAIAGVYNPLVLSCWFRRPSPRPGLGFKLAYNKACAEIRRVLDFVLDAAERTPSYPGTTRARDAEAARRIQNLNPIPRFTHPLQRRRITELVS